MFKINVRIAARSPEAKMISSPPRESNKVLSNIKKLWAINTIANMLNGAADFVNSQLRIVKNHGRRTT